MRGRLIATVVLLLLIAGYYFAVVKAPIESAPADIQIVESTDTIADRPSSNNNLQEHIETLVVESDRRTDLPSEVSEPFMSVSEAYFSSLEQAKKGDVRSQAIAALALKRCNAFDGKSWEDFEKILSESLPELTQQFRALWVSCSQLLSDVPDLEEQEARWHRFAKAGGSSVLKLENVNFILDEQNLDAREHYAAMLLEALEEAKSDPLLLEPTLLYAMNFISTFDNHRFIEYAAIGLTRCSYDLLCDPDEMKASLTELHHEHDMEEIEQRWSDLSLQLRAQDKFSLEKTLVGGY